MTGIYQIINIITSEIYVGKAINIQSRINRHKTLLKKNKHWNLHLQASWNKYGELNFEFNVINHCSELELDNFEKYYIAKLDSQRNGFNQTSGGDGLKNYKHNDITKKKISEASKKFKLSENHKQKLIAANTGRKKSKEELEKLSKAAKGRKISEWHKQQLINSTKGKPFSQDHKRKISEACKGRTIYVQQRADISKTLKGNKNAQKLSKDQKNKIKQIFLDQPKININDIVIEYNVSPSTIYGLRKEALFNK